MPIHRLLVAGMLAAASLVHLPTSLPRTGAVGLVQTDTAITEHLTDGFVDEWPAARFSTDKSSGIGYAIDNDPDYLYVALSIPTKAEQFRLSRSGMKFFIDPNGRKRETRGIEYPVRRERGAAWGNFGGGQPGSGQPGAQQGWKEAVSANLFTYRLFGYDETDEVEKAIDADGDLHIAFQWDDSGSLHIEYQVPLTRISDHVAGLHQKTIGIGWKVNGVDQPSDPNAGSAAQAGRTGGRRGATNPASSNFGGVTGNRGNIPGQAFVPPQIFWDRYIIFFSTD